MNKMSNVLDVQLNQHLLCSISALVVRFLTKRFIGDYERNAGESKTLN